MLHVQIFLDLQNGKQSCSGWSATLIPYGIENLGVEVQYDLKKAFDGADIIYMLRIQLERQKKFISFQLVNMRNFWFG